MENQNQLYRSMITSVAMVFCLDFGVRKIAILNYNNKKNNPRIEPYANR